MSALVWSALVVILAGVALASIALAWAVHRNNVYAVAEAWGRGFKEGREHELRTVTAALRPIADRPWNPLDLAPPLPGTVGEQTAEGSAP